MGVDNVSALPTSPAAAIVDAGFLLDLTLAYPNGCMDNGHSPTQRPKTVVLPPNGRPVCFFTAMHWIGDSQSYEVCFTELVISRYCQLYACTER